MNRTARVWLAIVTCVAAGSFLPSTASSAPGGTTAPVQRVLLLSVDGLHAVDLAAFVKAEPDSALAALSRTGVTLHRGGQRSAV